MSSPLESYRALLASGALHPDPAQAMAVEKLESLAKAVAAYEPSQGEGGWFARFGFANRTAPQLAWYADDGMQNLGKQGLYIYGDVGKGKSMLMDLFFGAAAVRHKRRVHFHEFMRDVHRQLHLLRQDKSISDPIPPLAQGIASEAWLLCFDEFQVTDIGDAMILGRVFQALFDCGVVMVVTSNRPPDDLFKGGLQRERFLPAIALIKERLDVLELAAARDYRLGRGQGIKVYHTPDGPAADEALESIFTNYNNGHAPRRDSIFVLGRELAVPRAGEGIAWFTFEELCERPLGPSDYLAIASLYPVVMLSGIPVLSPANRDAAKRFVTLIDALYEHNVELICSAAAPPDQLYPAGEGSFEFRRTVSRLMEMQAADYLALQHLP